MSIVMKHNNNIYLHISPWFYVVSFYGVDVSQHWVFTHYNVWDEITYSLLNFNGATVEV